MLGGEGGVVAGVQSCRWNLNGARARSQDGRHDRGRDGTWDVGRGIEEGEAEAALQNLKDCVVVLARPKFFWL
jgi:hypothetical protein